MKNITRPILALSLAVVLSACASHHKQDPIEPVNRAVFKFNDVVDGYVLKPVAQGYEAVVPNVAQTGVKNFFSNLAYPKVIINQFLQGKPKEGFQDTARFLVNSTLGVAGFIDVAEPAFGLKAHKEDFGQTLGVWGVNTGPYVILPLLGPSTLRDTAGMFADSQIDLTETRYVRERRATKNRAMAVNVVSKRAELLEVERLVSGDKYAFMRDAYLQKREDLIRDGQAPEEDPFLMDDEF